ncbi:hypothetical protein ACGFNU_31700 [Spirillospora sp. NPDC048911]|uniref:hypothetical protein n=1 Tax=Spirillospora sp. NPDC048911 TaxID=3364527 RepID=UPI003722039B
MWADVRKRLNASRADLGVVADGLYPGATRAGSTALLTRPEWIVTNPIPLEAVRLEWEPEPEPPAVADPPEGLPAGFRTYAEAMAALAPPAVFENRRAYRLLDANLDTGLGATVLRLGPAYYFDAVNVGESAAHELAAHELAEEAAGLPLRTRLGDPCDLARRAALPAITTVTVRAGDPASYVLHWRDPEKVAHAGGLYQVMPVGVFQPLGDDVDDLDLWGSMKREYSEEFLGNDEVLDRHEPRFASFARDFDAARGAGEVRPYVLGLGVDPLTFALDLLTAVVIEPGTFDRLFAGLVQENDEGKVAMAPFDGTVPQPMQPAGAAALDLARRHRGSLLRRT